MRTLVVRVHCDHGDVVHICVVVVHGQNLCRRERWHSGPNAVGGEGRRRRGKVLRRLRGGPSARPCNPLNSAYSSPRVKQRSTVDWQSQETDVRRRCQLYDGVWVWGPVLDGGDSDVSGEGASSKVCELMQVFAATTLQTRAVLLARLAVRRRLGR